MFSSTLCGSATPQQDAKQSSLPSPHSVGSHRKAVGVPNFGEVSPRLFRGGQPGVNGLEALHKLGITIIVDMRSGPDKNEEADARRLGMKYVSIPWHCPFPSDKPFAEFLHVVRDNPHKKVFVHCRLGDDRTGMAVAAYRMADEGWSAEEALSEMKEFGFTGIHHAICTRLAHYEKKFPEHLKTNPAFKDVVPQSSTSTK